MMGGAKIYSMTGFATGEMDTGEYHLKCEVKSVNHRYLDIKSRLPREWNLLEHNIRKLASKYFSRGYVDITIKKRVHPGKLVEAFANDEICASLVGRLRDIIQKNKLDKNLGIQSILPFRDILNDQVEDENIQKTWEKHLSALLEKAFKDLVGMRESEGAFLKVDLEKHLELMKGHWQKIVEQREEADKEIKGKFSEKISKYLDASIEVDQNRLAQEIAILMDKADIAEELSRLESHFKHMSEFLDSGKKGDGIGKKIDFLLQEFNREVNTIASKCQYAQISNSAIEMKHLIEKMREQAQNIE